MIEYYCSKCGKYQDVLNEREQDEKDKSGFYKCEECKNEEEIQ